MTEIRIRTAAWDQEEVISLRMPSGWRVTEFRPRTPPPLTDSQIAESLENPVGQPPIRNLCRGKSRPLVIVDDLSRPTPAGRVFPFLLRWFQDAGIPAERIRVLIATGTHSPPATQAIAKKIGPAAMACRTIVHDPDRGVVAVGKTSFGTPVTVNRELLESDLIIGIGGVYPNHTAGFGGGSKLALGVLGYHSIQRLHLWHGGCGWGTHSKRNSFRMDLDEISEAIRLHTTISLFVNADREVVDLICGDHLRYFPSAVSLARRYYSAPAPQSADVVVCNAYPADISLTLACTKGFAQLSHCRTGASRIGIAACSQGLGGHRLFPLNPSRLHRFRQIARRAWMVPRSEIARKTISRLRGVTNHAGGGMKHRPIWVYRPAGHPDNLVCPGMSITSSWSEIVSAVSREQAGKPDLDVVLYSCAPLQSFDLARHFDSEIEVNDRANSVTSL